MTFARVPVKKVDLSSAHAFSTKFLVEYHHKDSIALNETNIYLCNI